MNLIPCSETSEIQRESTQYDPENRTSTDNVRPKNSAIFKIVFIYGLFNEAVYSLER
jgi:hypothetical protein